MSQAIAQPFDCSNVCVPTGTSSTPGPTGPPGADGTNGTDGLNAFSLSTTGTDLMPAEGGSVTITVTPTSDWMTVDQIVYVQFWGYMQVTDKPTDTTVTLKNLAVVASGIYPDNAAAGTLLPAGAEISPAGIQGPTGTTDTSLFLQKANNLNDLADPATARGNLGLGTVATFTEGVDDGEVPRVDDATGIDANEFVVGTGTGVAGYDPTAAGVLLGLGSAAYKDAAAGDGDVPLIEDPGGINNNEALFGAAGGGIKAVDAATARTLLGISSSSLDYLLFRQVEASGAQGGAFATGGWRTVPLNTKVADSGGHGSIAANQITLDAGTYRYSYGLVASKVDSFRGRLYDITAGALIADSYSASMDEGNLDINFVAQGAGRFTLAVQSVIELQGVSETTGVFGLGFVTFGIDEYYSWIALEME